MWDYDSRLIAEEAWAEYEKELSPEEIAEMVRRQEFEMTQDYFDQAFKAIREADEALKD